MNFKKTLTAAAALTLFSLPALAVELTNQTFDVDPPLADTQADGVWFIDRAAPAGFSSQFFNGDNRLAHTISSADASGGFTATQGRAFQTVGANELQIDMFISSDFDGATGRIGGLWGVGTGVPGDFSGPRTAFPILEFYDNQFKVFDIDGLGGPTDSIGFHEIGLPSGFDFDEFVTLNILLDLTDDLFRFSVNGEELHTEGANGSAQIAGAILQNINSASGVDRTIFFDNFIASGPAAVPLPAGLPLLAVAIGVLGVASRRRKRT